MLIRILTSEEKEEILLVISLWRESGLNQGEFCRREGIARSTFQSWRRSYDPTYQATGSRSKKNPSKPSFLPLAIQEEELPSYTSEEIEICYGNGISIKCSSALPVPYLKKLLSIQLT